MSLKSACIEEAAEVICGINILDQTGDSDNLKEELGDLLLQVVMHAQIAKEERLLTPLKLKGFLFLQVTSKLKQVQYIVFSSSFSYIYCGSWSVSLHFCKLPAS